MEAFVYTSRSSWSWLGISRKIYERDNTIGKERILMIKLSFVQGSRLRKVLINGRQVSFVSNETGWIPVKVDIDKIKENEKVFKKLNTEEKKMLEQCKNLNTEKELCNDIIKDFKKTGWRLIKRA